MSSCSSLVVESLCSTVVPRVQRETLQKAFLILSPRDQGRSLGLVGWQKFMGDGPQQGIGLVFSREDGISSSPGDADFRITPQHPVFVIRVVEIGALIEKLSGF